MCLEPGASTAAIALANGLNADLVRLWALSLHRATTPGFQRRKQAPVHIIPAVIPIKLASLLPASAMLQHSKNLKWGVQCRVSSRHFQKIIVRNGHDAGNHHRPVWSRLIRLKSQRPVWGEHFGAVAASRRPTPVIQRQLLRNEAQKRKCSCRWCKHLVYLKLVQNQDLATLRLSQFATSLIFQH